MKMDLHFYRDKRIFVTGHTGFKGSWLCKILSGAGADVTGYSNGIPTDPSLFTAAGIERDVRTVWGDVCNFAALRQAFEEADPEIVLHLAAQPIVRESYRNPRKTYETNVMGTVNLLECVRLSGRHVRSVVNVTTDKVYLNRERPEGYREEEELDGFDPYSNSKSCSELVTRCYRRSFLQDVPVSTVRAGNVIGGGDFAVDRIVPDCVRAVKEGRDIEVRNPGSTRPYQHVLEPLFAYLLVAQRQYGDPSLAGCYNVGPDDNGCSRTGELVDLFIKAWGGGIRRVNTGSGGPHEAYFLKLDNSRMKHTFGWQPRWNLEMAIEKVVEWSRCWLTGGDVRHCMEEQIASYQQGI